MKLDVFFSSTKIKVDRLYHFNRSAVLSRSNSTHREWRGRSPPPKNAGNTHQTTAYHNPLIAEPGHVVPAPTQQWCKDRTGQDRTGQDINLNAKYNRVQHGLDIHTHLSSEIPLFENTICYIRSISQFCGVSGHYCVVFRLILHMLFSLTVWF